jgi:protein gp37
MNRASSATGWVKNPDGTQGYTWNPITGCLNHVNGLCKGGGFPCYAYKLANGRLKQRYLANKNIPPAVPATNLTSPIYSSVALIDPFYPRFWEEKLTTLHVPRKAGSPAKGIFVCDMGELFGHWIPRTWQDQVFNAIKANPDYRFYLLTKQPQNLIKFSPFPENCWVGVTATSIPMVIEATKWLAGVQAKVKYLSLEPLVEWELGEKALLIGLLLHAGVSWLIMGAQTNPYKPPEIEWVRQIVEAADKAGIPVFLKDNVRPLFRQTMPWWALDTNRELYRQEMPCEKALKSASK